MISIIQLEYLIAIDTYKNYAKAADRCSVTQPTLSMQIKKLEEELGVVIFDRSKQPVITTDVGKVIVDQARIALREIQKINILSEEFNQTISGRLKVGIIPTISAYLLPLFIGIIAEKFPDVQLSITEAYTNELIRMLKSDLLDVAIVATPEHDEAIIEDKIYYEEIKVYTAFGHPLIQKDKLTTKDIQRDDIWMLSHGNCFRNQVINLCSQPNEVEMQKQISYESTSLETLKKLVDSEGGFMLMPELATLELNSRQIKQVKSFEQPVPLREIGLIYVRSVSKIQLIQILKEVVTQAVPSEMLNSNRGQVVEWQ